MYKRQGYGYLLIELIEFKLPARLVFVIAQGPDAVSYTHLAQTRLAEANTSADMDSAIILDSVPVKRNFFRKFLNYFNAVSYTHLDVYKRQTMSC